MAISRVTISGPTKGSTSRRIGGANSTSWSITITERSGFLGTRVQSGTFNATSNFTSGVLSLNFPITNTRSFPVGVTPQFWVRSFDTNSQNSVTELGTPPAFPTASSPKLRLDRLKPSGICANNPNMANWQLCVSRLLFAPTNTVFFVGGTHNGQPFQQGPITAKPRGFMKPCGDVVKFCLPNPGLGLTIRQPLPDPHPDWWVVSFSPLGRNRVIEFGTPPPLLTASQPPPPPGPSSPEPRFPRSTIKLQQASEPTRATTTGLAFKRRR